MDHDELDALIQDVLDGVATPAQVARLESRMAHDPAARARRAELERLFSALGRVPRLEAPPELKGRILRALPPGAPGLRVGVPAVTRQRRMRLAWVFAAGLAAGVIGAGALVGLWKAPGGGLPTSGSMMPSGSARPGTPASSGGWRAGKAFLHAASWRSGGSRFVLFQVLRGADLSAEVTFDPAVLGPGTFRGASPGSPLLEPGRVAFLGVEGTGYLVELPEHAGAAGTPLHVRIRSGGQEAEGDLPAPPASPALR